LLPVLPGEKSAESCRRTSVKPPKLSGYAVCRPRPSVSRNFNTEITEDAGACTDRARRLRGGNTDTPGISPSISRCIHGLLQEVSQYSRFIHGGATDGTACSR